MKALADASYRLLDRFDHAGDPRPAIVSQTAEDMGALYDVIELNSVFELGLSRFVKQLANTMNNAKKQGNLMVQTVFDWAVYFTNTSGFSFNPTLFEPEILRCFDESAYIVQRALVAIKPRIRFEEIVRNQTATTWFIELAASIYTEGRVRTGQKHMPMEQMIATEVDRAQILNYFATLEEPPVADVDLSKPLFHSLHQNVEDTASAYEGAPVLVPPTVRIRGVREDMVVLISQACHETMDRCMNPADVNGDVGEALIGQKSQAYLTALTCLRERARAGSNPSHHTTARDTYNLIEKDFHARVLFADLVSVFNAHILSKRNRTDARKPVAGMLRKRQNELIGWFGRYFESIE